MKLATLDFQPAHELGSSELADVLLPYHNMLVIGFVCLNRQWIVFDRANNTKPGLRQTQRQPAAT